MNLIALLCREIAQNKVTSQRHLAVALDVSLGKMNQLVKTAQERGLVSYAQGAYSLTKAGLLYLEQFRVDNAIILAAGFGSRFVPMSYNNPKGLTEVMGTPMIERQILQLHERGIYDIIIVVGYLKEKFEYLIDKYGVRLVFNPEYQMKNNHVSLYCVREYLKRSYILVSDNWMQDNIFNTWEPNSWIACIYEEGDTSEWVVSADNRQRIRRIGIGGRDSWVIAGPSFFDAESAQLLAQLTEQHYSLPGTDDHFWEHILKDNLGTLRVYINRQRSDNLFEFERLEELRGFDERYQLDSGNPALREIAEVFGVYEDEITGIKPLKDGMTNYSFAFEVKGRGYVFRLPGRDAERLIDRYREKAAYGQVAHLGITDEIVSLNAASGTKISRYYPDTHILDWHDERELDEALRLVRMVHGSGCETGHDFDIAAMISQYRALADEASAIRFGDFDVVSHRMSALLDFKKRLAAPRALCHGDFIHANVLIFPDGSGKLIDWEYSGMGDPLIDVAMFAIFALMGRLEAEALLARYLDRAPHEAERARLYLYMALGGYLWSIWAELKQAGGQEFGAYPLQMYRYAKDYYYVLAVEGFLGKEVQAGAASLSTGTTGSFTAVSAATAAAARKLARGA
ncbi:MAG: phosphotransferase [Coriobacteriales bacterium]|nr:phosphotransferase [Coriobacteriales bacterium]